LEISVDYDTDTVRPTLSGVGDLVHPFANRLLDHEALLGPLGVEADPDSEERVVGQFDEGVGRVVLGHVAGAPDGAVVQCSRAAPLAMNYEEQGEFCLGCIRVVHPRTASSDRNTPL